MGGCSSDSAKMYLAEGGHVAEHVVASLHHSWDEQIVAVPDTWLGFSQLGTHNLAKCLDEIGKFRKKTPSQWDKPYTPSLEHIFDYRTFNLKDFLQQLGMSEYHESIKKHYQRAGGGMKEFTMVHIEDAAFDAMGVKPAHHPKIRKALELYRTAVKKSQNETPLTKGAHLDDLLALEPIATKGKSGELDEEDAKQVAVFCMDFRSIIIENPKLNLVRKVHLPDDLWIGAPMEQAELKLLYHMFDQADNYNNGEITHQELENYFSKNASTVASSVFLASVCADYGAVSGHPGFLDLATFCTLVETIAVMNEEELLHFGFNELQLNQNSPQFDAVDFESLLQRFDAFNDVDDELNHQLVAHMRKTRKHSAQHDARDLPESMISWNQFIVMHKEQPAATFPLFYIQEVLRKKVHGKKWWEHRRQVIGSEVDINAIHCRKSEEALERAQKEHNITYQPRLKHKKKNTHGGLDGEHLVQREQMVNHHHRMSQGKSAGSPDNSKKGTAAGTSEVGSRKRHVQPGAKPTPDRHRNRQANSNNTEAGARHSHHSKKLQPLNSPPRVNKHHEHKKKHHSKK